MIDLQNLGVTFQANTPLETHALKTLDLKIKEEQWVVIIGSNGAGKSTLLNTISGEILPTQGKIFLDQEDISQWPPFKRAKSIARVFQNPLMGTCANLSIEENLSLSATRGLKRNLRPALNTALRQQLTDQICSLNLGLEHRLKDKMSTLSGGQRQAVSLFMATQRPMKVLLLDEHTAALDPKTSQFVLGLTQKLITEKKLTTLMVTHSMRQALDYGKRILMLDSGKIVLDLQENLAGLTTQDLLALFEDAKGGKLHDDRILLD